MVSIFYPKKKGFKASALDSQSVTRGFPAYSISLYDDPEFIFKRQSINGAQILSNIISDDLYPITESSQDKSNYDIGFGTLSKLFYVKVLVYKNIAQDIVDDYSNVFSLTKTQNFGNTNTVYYPIRCIAKNSAFTEYSATISLLNSDFVNDFDGYIYLNLEADYDFRISTSIGINITDSATTSLTQSATPVTATIASKSNGKQFFTADNKTFKFIEQSNNFDFNYQAIVVNLTSSLFSTANVIATTPSTGSFFRFTFNNEETLSDLKYFAVTFRNVTPSYDPFSDTGFRIIFSDINGNKISFENCTILENKVSGYYDIIFTLHDVPDFTEFLNYMILEIQSNVALTSSYEITFLYFLQKSQSTQAFTAMALKINLPDIYTYDPLGSKIDSQELREGHLLQSSDLFNTVENIITCHKEVCYEITVDDFKVELPEFCSIKADTGYKIVNSISRSTPIYTINGLKTPKNIRVKPPRDIRILDVRSNSDYVLNGFYIKNPIYLKDLSREILPKINYSQENFFRIDRKKYFFSEYTDLGFYEYDIILPENIIHVFSFPEKTEIKMYLDNEEEILIKTNFAQKIQPGKQTFTTSSNSFTMKSSKSIVVKKIIAS